MEDILSSIRKIISDDDEGAPQSGEDEALSADTELSQEELDKLFDSPVMAEPEPEVSKEADVLELTEAQAISSDLPIVNGLPDGDTGEGGDIAFMEEAEPEMPAEIARQEDIDDLFAKPDPVATAPEPAPQPAPTISAESITAQVSSEPIQTLLSDQANQAVSSSFNGLATTLLSQNARTLEDLVAEMLRPMLKSWLDQHLPSMVERLVQQEIERISRSR
ncbi:DUF2497 domain-containing protein [Pseudovibrio flavus]|uniref:DUF2497 domain-containing protein n=1 Tax=Pseudovibrio flavus TaxID=2529854 RepID=UPI0027B8AD3F|nr:DUF2497 domain-containing protein [Pseudovibrio flavus]